MGKAISETLRPHLVTIQLEANTQEAALKEVASLLKSHPNMSNFDGFFTELLLREKLESTCLGMDTAFPHARTDHVKNLVIAAGVSREGILFEKTNQTVKLIFVIGTPKRMVTEYLATVGALARLLKEEILRNKLFSAKTAEEFLFFIAEAEGKA
ncbi:MAG: PTS sugar transporter subunit IIA [Blastochloris sp.]|nr:PTS sugar transporter subunit IIA [Blastochloris sp.]